MGVMRGHHLHQQLKSKSLEVLLRTAVESVSGRGPAWPPAAETGQLAGRPGEGYPEMGDWSFACFG